MNSIDTLDFKLLEADIATEIASGRLLAGRINEFREYLKNSVEFEGLQEQVDSYVADYFFKQAWYSYTSGRIDQKVLSEMLKSLSEVMEYNTGLYLKFAEYLDLTRNGAGIKERLAVLESCCKLVKEGDSINFTLMCKKELLGLYLNSSHEYVDKIGSLSTEMKPLIEERKKLRHINLSVEIST